MNTPKSRKRASFDPDLITGPAVLSHPISDHVAAYIGLIVTEYTHLEKAMIGVFRVILGIESGEAAALAYYAIKAPKTRWDIARKVLEKDHRHIETTTSYDELIDDFQKITDFRNTCVHSRWDMDARNQPWLTKSNEPLDELRPTRFRKSEFDNMLTYMHEFRDRAITVSSEDRFALDRRWLGLPPPDRDNNPSAPTDD